jgi:hypothetical protein
MRINPSIVLIPLFGVEVPASSKGIRFSTEFLYCVLTSPEPSQPVLVQWSMSVDAFVFLPYYGWVVNLSDSSAQSFS